MLFLFMSVSRMIVSCVYSYISFQVTIIFSLSKEQRNTAVRLYYYCGSNTAEASRRVGAGFVRYRAGTSKTL